MNNLPERDHFNCLIHEKDRIARDERLSRGIDGYEKGPEGLLQYVDDQFTNAAETLMSDMLKPWPESFLSASSKKSQDDPSNTYGGILDKEILDRYKI